MIQDLWVCDRHLQRIWNCCHRIFVVYHDKGITVAQPSIAWAVALGDLVNPLPGSS